MEGIPLQLVFEKADWMTLVILLVCVFLWIIWGKAGGFLEQKTSDIFHSHQRKSLFSVDTLSEFRLGLFLTLIYLITFGIYLHHQYAYWSGTSSVYVFLIAVAGLFLYHGLKLLILRLAAYVFDAAQQVRQWTGSYIVLNYITGLLFIPIIIGVTYGNEKVAVILLNGSIFLLLLYFIFLFIRFFNIFFSNISSIIYVFLYFCTLEILPLALLYKSILLR